ncbi:hypothetical protein GCM10008018_66230 [Paenibacillus marchantiophytorum]|uniref:Phage major capsid protein n=1 Tax=Paenibacillus marchantiophytorum TaxID=1619310 RepID=A0ABQ1FI27_9BACL|nr:DUF5309 family protein [Paenibacillus marchantiophytorum]GGA11911.1 hypothetical protein GCM10008018_66230 [Paenibacillus marchantiophytorum]
MNTTNLTTQENISLVKEIAMVAPIDTPLTTLLLANGKEKPSTAKIHVWREKTLNLTDDVSVAEGSDATNFANGVRAEMNNVMEIFMKSAKVSGTAQASGAVGDLFSGEINDRLAELKVNIEKRLIGGVKDDGSLSGIRKMDGILKFVDASNKIVGATKGVITEVEVKQLARKLWEQGAGTGKIYALVNADIKEQIDELYKDRYNYQAKTNEFGLVVQTIDTNYGRLNFVLDRHMPIDKIIAFDLNALSIAWLRQPVFELLGKTGDSTQGQVLAEATLEVLSKKAVVEYTIKA